MISFISVGFYPGFILGVNYFIIKLLKYLEKKVKRFTL